MPSPERNLQNPTRADVDARIGETFLALNQIASSLALIERSCSRVLEILPDDPSSDDVFALRAAGAHAHLTIEQIGDVADTLTTVLRFLTQQKARAVDACLCLAGAGGNH